MKSIICAVVLLVEVIFICRAYDLQLDTQQDVLFWKFKGHSSYVSKLIDGGRFVPNFQPPPGSAEPYVTNGVWAFTHKNFDPLDGWQSYAQAKFRLKHHLMAEVIARVLASPDVIIELKVREGKVIRRFRSDGKSWCDAMFNDFKQLDAEINVAANLTDPGMYFLLDKVTIGAMAPIRNIDRSTLNPCTTVNASEIESTTSAPPLQITPGVTPDFANNTVIKMSTTPAPITATDEPRSLVRVVRNAVPTTTSTQSNVNGLKCDCSCKCGQDDDENEESAED